LRYFYFANNQTIVKYRLQKIKSMIDHLQGKYSNAINLRRNLCIDESLLLWKERLKFKHLLSLKRNRFGIKLFELVDCSSEFLLHFIVYIGADIDYKKFQLKVSKDVVAHFIKPYF